MNATQTLIIQNLAFGEGSTVAQLIERTGKGQTTIRENLKKLELDNLVERDGKEWFAILVEDEDGAPLPAEDQPAVTVEEAMVESYATDESEVADELDRLAEKPEPKSISVGEFMDSILGSGKEINSPADVAEHVAAATGTAAEHDAREAAKNEAEAPAKKVYRRHATPTTRTIRINQITKSEVQVVRADELDIEDADSKWYTLCLTHDVMEGSDLVLDAHFKSSYPEFCPSCAPLLVGKVGRRRVAKKD